MEQIPHSGGFVFALCRSSELIGAAPKQKSTAVAVDCSILCRDDKIRTCDPLHPMDSMAKRDAAGCYGFHRLIAP